MKNRYFLSPEGAVTKRMKGPPGACHVDISREVLPQLGCTPADIEDCYRQMFRRRYVRVVEHDDRNIEVEYGPELTAAQKRFVDDQKAAGKTVNLFRAKLR